jgi:predicted ATPase
MSEYSTAPRLPIELSTSIGELALRLPEIETNWCVLTGGPCSGKSSIRNMLADLGHATFPETAEVIIKEGVALGMTPEEVRADLSSFQEHILAADLSIALSHPPEELTFFDTSLIDDLVYQDVYTESVYPEGVLSVIDCIRYRTVCIFDQLPHQMNGIRVEDHDLSRQINARIEEYYRAAGYEIHRIPVDTPERRLERILELVF